eukprot:261407-Chlamydomonas_euryale.AAC.1
MPLTGGSSEVEQPAGWPLASSPRLPPSHTPLSDVWAGRGLRCCPVLHGVQCEPPLASLQLCGRRGGGPAVSHAHV